MIVDSIGSMPQLEIRENRLMILPISGSLFLDMFTAGTHDGYEVIKDMVPDDAKVRHVRYSFDHHDTIEILIESAQFDVVKDGDRIPELIPRLKRIPISLSTSIGAMA